jgi:hypothetical protein
MSNGLGGLRRSHVVTTYGPGAIIDFRAPKSGAPLSGVLAGLEEWDRNTKQGRGGLLHPQVIREPRLEKRLGVNGFRLPPVRERSANDDDVFDVLPVVRFPQWLQCPGCNRLQRADQWSQEPGNPERWCYCKGRTDPTSVVPVRFILACEDGHLGEFPWQEWVGCSCTTPLLSLDTRTPGLGGKIVRCAKCGSERSLEGVFAKQALAELKLRCSGYEPWLAVEQRVKCSKPPRVLQRGASNVYWGDTRSALDIPPFSPDPAEMFGPFWNSVREVSPEDWPAFMRMLKLSEKLATPESVLLLRLNEWHRIHSADDPQVDVEVDEYRQFERALREPIQGHREFDTRPSIAPTEFREHFEGVALARRLREVRVQVGFTRIQPPGGMFRASNARPGRLSETRLPWLPAIELRGEGIFLAFREDAVKTWESRPEVDTHVSAMAARVRKELLREAQTDSETSEVEAKFNKWRPIAPRFVMIHSFAHAFMRRLALECGYSSAALRERLFVGNAPIDMVGVLIHTDSPDSEGTLGGLVRQGTPDRLRDTLVGLLRDARWCSSDPVCITGTMTLSTPRNGAACHACLLAPETSCQHFNTLLDRALLVGTEEMPSLGFFRDVLEEFG